jgi:uncharacterized protein DUF3108
MLRVERRLPASRCACLAAALALGAAPALADTALRAHEILYRFSFRGLGGGDLKLTLTQGPQPGSWVYETRSYPSFLARLVVSPDSRERSWFSIVEGGVRPERYRLEDGASNHAENSDLHYDYATGHITGTARGAPLDLPLEPGLQDVMSIRLAPTVDLLAGREPHEYAMLDGREVKHYVYSRVGAETLNTALGRLDTVVITSDRKGSDGRGRTWRYWYAPSLGWLTVRAEQREAGEARLALAVRSLKWLDSPATTTR